MTKNKLYIFLLLAFLVSCAPGPVDVAKGYKVISEADQAAKTAEQERKFSEDQHAAKLEREQYWAGVWNEVRPAVVFLGRLVLYSLYFLVIVFAISLSYMSFRSARAYGTFIDIRVSLIHPDRETGVRPQILMPVRNALPEPRPGKFDLFHLGNTTRWLLIDSMTGERTFLDETQPAQKAQLEVYRQLLHNYQTSKRQLASGKRSPEGEVAEAIGSAGIQLPDPNVFFDNFDDNALINLVRERLNEKEQGNG
jgi:hypothetical protein